VAGRGGERWEGGRSGGGGGSADRGPQPGLAEGARLGGGQPPRRGPQGYQAAPTHPADRGHLPDSRAPRRQVVPALLRRTPFLIGRPRPRPPGKSGTAGTTLTPRRVQGL